MIALIDYEAGNTCSVMNALDRLDADYLLTDNHEEIQSAERVIFPGVGHAGAAMNALERKGLVSVIRSLKQPVLGICVGMQLLAEKSEEGDTACLGIINGTVKRFIPTNKSKVPHMGWNNVQFEKQDGVFKSIGDGAYFYFVHSYYLPQGEYSIANCTHDINFSAAVRHNNFRGIQFHAEKSGPQGAQLIANFLNEK